MGQVGTKELDKVKAQSLLADSAFEEPQLEDLFNAFSIMDINNPGKLSKKFLVESSPGLLNNPVLGRFFEVVGREPGVIDFYEFISNLNIFITGSEEEKIRFLFDMYDYNMDGYISNGDLFRTLKILVGKNLNDVQIQQLVDRTIVDFDKDEDDRLNFDEFKEAVKTLGIGERMKIELEFGN